MSASVSCWRLKGLLMPYSERSAPPVCRVCGSMLLFLASRLPPSCMPMPVSSCWPTCALLCSRRAWVISWPMTAASSSSVRFSFSTRPLYTAILPPGIAQALSSSERMTCISQLNGTPVRLLAFAAGTMRLKMLCTRWAVGERVSSAFWLCASPRICW